MSHVSADEADERERRARERLASRGAGEQHALDQLVADGTNGEALEPRTASASPSAPTDGRGASP